MYNILDIQKNNNIYKIKLLIQINNDILIYNLIKDIQEKDYEYNEENGLLIDNNSNKYIFLDKVKNNFNDSYDYISNLLKENKNKFNMFLATTMLGTSLYASDVKELPKNFNHNMGITQSSMVLEDDDSNNINNNDKNFIRNEREINKRNGFVQKNVGEQYIDLLKSLQIGIVNDFYKENKYDLDKKGITKEQILKNLILQVGFNNSLENNYSLRIDKDMLREFNISNSNFKSMLKNVIEEKQLTENTMVGSITLDEVFKNNGFTSISIPLEMLDNLSKNSNDQEYLTSFTKYLKNVSNHELSHLYLNANEFKAVEQQKENITNKEFIDDLKQINKKMDLNDSTLGSMTKAIVNKENIKSNLNPSLYPKDEYIQSYNRLNSLLNNTNNIKTYLGNKVSNENSAIYCMNTRDVLKDSKYVNNIEYLSTIIKDDFLNIKDFSKEEKKYIDLEKIANADIEPAGGHIYNLMLLLEESNSPEIDKYVFKQMTTKNLLENIFQEKFNPNNKEHQIFFNKINQKVNDLEDVVKEHEMNKVITRS